MRIPGRVRGLFWWTDFYIMWRKIRARRVLHFKINHCMEAQEIWLRILFWLLVNAFHSLDNWKFRKESPVLAIPLLIQQEWKKKKKKGIEGIPWTRHKVRLQGKTVNNKDLSDSWSWEAGGGGGRAGNDADECVITNWVKCFRRQDQSPLKSKEQRTGWGGEQ